MLQCDWLRTLLAIYFVFRDSQSEGIVSLSDSCALISYHANLVLSSFFEF